MHPFWLVLRVLNIDNKNVTLNVANEGNWKSSLLYNVCDVA